MNEKNEKENNETFSIIEPIVSKAVDYFDKKNKYLLIEKTIYLYVLIGFIFGTVSVLTYLRSVSGESYMFFVITLISYLLLNLTSKIRSETEKV